METKYSKGEWKLRGNKIFIGDTYKSIATIHVCKNHEDVTFKPIEDIEANANAKVLVSAVENLEQCDYIKFYAEQALKSLDNGSLAEVRGLLEGIVKRTTDIINNSI